MYGSNLVVLTGQKALPSLHPRKAAKWVVLFIKHAFRLPVPAFDSSGFAMGQPKNPSSPTAVTPSNLDHWAVPDFGFRSLLQPIHHQLSEILQVASTLGINAWFKAPSSSLFPLSLWRCFLGTGQPSHTIPLRLGRPSQPGLCQPRSCPRHQVSKSKTTPPTTCAST
jgi:hypothetical protein